MYDISIILTTARDDFSIIGMPETHILDPCIKSLKNQTFKDFELVVVDSLIDLRPNMFKGQPFQEDKLLFEVKHVPVHPNHRFWLDRKMWNFCGCLNTAIIHTEGELIVKLDDCCQLKEDYLERIWNSYQSGYFPLALHTKYRNGKQAYYNKKYRQARFKSNPNLPEWKQKSDKNRQKSLSKVYEEDKPIICSRWSVVDDRGGRMIAPHNWFYGYSSFPLEAALKVNGYDENMDPTHGLDDVDMGSRLEMAGYRGLFLLDTDLWVIEHEHKAISKHAINYDRKPVVCNYAHYLISRKKKRWRANSYKLTEEDLEFIKEEGRRPPCSPQPDFYVDDMEGSLFKAWAERQPMFDLREERLEL